MECVSIELTSEYKSSASISPRGYSVVVGSTLSVSSGSTEKPVNHTLYSTFLDLDIATISNDGQFMVRGGTGAQLSSVDLIWEPVVL